MTTICEKCKKSISKWEKLRPEICQVHRWTGVWYCVKCAAKHILKLRKKGEKI